MVCAWGHCEWAAVQQHQPLLGMCRGPTAIPLRGKQCVRGRKVHVRSIVRCCAVLC